MIRIGIDRSGQGVLKRFECARLFLFAACCRARWRDIKGQPFSNCVLPRDRKDKREERADRISLASGDGGSRGQMEDFMPAGRFVWPAAEIVDASIAHFADIDLNEQAIIRWIKSTQSDFFEIHA